MSDKKAKLKDMPEIIKNMIYRQLEARKLKLRFVELEMSMRPHDDDEECQILTFYLSSFCERKMHYQHLFKVGLKETIYPAFICEKDVLYEDASDSDVVKVTSYIELENIIGRIISREDIKKFIEQEEYLSGIDLWRDAVYSGCFDKNKEG